MDKKNVFQTLIWVIAVVMVIVAVIVVVTAGDPDEGRTNVPTQPMVPVQTAPGVIKPLAPTLPLETTEPSEPDGTEPSVGQEPGEDPGEDTREPEQTEPRQDSPVTPEDPIELEQELSIIQVGSYTGMYVEDGSGTFVEDVMMVVLHNTAQEDLQLVRIDMDIDGEHYQFQCTNLPSGSAAVLLDEQYKPAASAAPEQAQISLCVFFEEPMDLAEGVLEISGNQGILTVTNVSGQDLTEDFYVYYKYYATGYFYGGITFRTKIEGGLAAGESVQVIARHYTPNGSEIVQVTYGS